jgi:hypothetical protein
MPDGSDSIGEKIGCCTKIGQSCIDNDPTEKSSNPIMT